jgi:hypothetical protein
VNGPRALNYPYFLTLALPLAKGYLNPTSMPSREGLRENPKATARKEAQKSAQLRKQKRKVTRSDDDIDGNSTDSGLIVLPPKKKCSKLFQRKSEGGDNCNVSDDEVDTTNTPGSEIDEVMSIQVIKLNKIH